MKKAILVISVLSLMLASFTAGVEYQRGDVDQNGRVNIDDVTFLIDYLLKGTWGDEPVTPVDNHEYVDLGLPSGTLWATCNVGANAPEDYGDYFAWGETSPKEVYTWETYKWCNGSMYDLTIAHGGQGGFGRLGQHDIHHGAETGKTQGPARLRLPLFHAHDAAAHDFRHVSRAVQAAGNHADDQLIDAGTIGDWWSRSCYTSNGISTYAFGACDIGFNWAEWTQFLNGTNGYRYYGHSVRAVRVPEE